MPPRALLPLALTVLVACSAAAPEVDVSKGQIRADMREYAMGLTANEVRAGSVTFIARDAGTVAHQLVVIRTDTPADKLAVDKATQKAGEDGKVGAIEEVRPGTSLNLEIDLPPGHYAVICNVPTHYQLGMRADLTVR